MTKVPLTDVLSDFASRLKLNANFDTTSAAFDNTLSRDGTSPNQMLADFDMNSHHILNLPPPTSPTDAVRLQDVASGTVISALTLVYATLDTYSALRSYTMTAAMIGQLFFVRGALSIGDLGAGFFRCQSTAVTEDGGISIVSNTSGYYFVRQYSGPVSLGWYCKGDDTVDDTAQFANWQTAINGKWGFIPVPPSKWKLGTASTGVTFSGQVYTRVDSAPGATMDLTGMSSSYAIILTNNQNCVFNFPLVQCGYSGVLMNTTSAATQSNTLSGTFSGTGRQSTRPADPMINRVGIYIQGGASGKANYYNVINNSIVQNFDTSIAFYTPAGGVMNANANSVLGATLSGFWWGFYTNSQENNVSGLIFTSTSAGTDDSHPVECIRIGDGTYATAYNYVQGVAEPGLHSIGVHCLANSQSNLIVLMDNTSLANLDDSSSNNIINKNTWTLQAGKVIFTSIQTVPVTVANLPATGGGMRAQVTDATTTTFNSIVAGSGSNTVPVFWDGTNWRIG